MLAKRSVAPLVGHDRPRIAPPLPARSDIAGLQAMAERMGIKLMPHQVIAGRYMEATGADGRHLYREVADIEARQNGKTEKLVPLICKRLLANRRITHAAQNVKLPLAVFEQVGEFMWNHHADLFPQRNGRATRPRYANGKEEIRLSGGGVYRIVAATRSGARGQSNDDLIIDEVREFDDWDFINAAKPTLSASLDPQIIYLSNAGDDLSVVLNALRSRSESDPSLAYLEWSASPERPIDDPIGWAEANPAMGHEAEGMGSLYETLSVDLRTAQLEGTIAAFETEHLCRWVRTMRPALVTAEEWAECRSEGKLPRPRRAHMAVSMDPDGKRASAAVAWLGTDDVCYLTTLEDVTGDPIRTSLVGKQWRDAAQARAVPKVGFDPMTDAELAKFFPATKSVSGAEFANATENFVRLVKGGGLRWADAEAVGTDLGWTARKDHGEAGYLAVRANDDRPITASLAAIRAVWLATGIRPAKPRVY